MTPYQTNLMNSLDSLKRAEHKLDYTIFRIQSTVNKPHIISVLQK